MNLRFYYLVNVILISRLVFLVRDRPLGRRGLSLIVLLQLAGLLVFHIGPALGVLAVLLLLLNILLYYLERKTTQLNALRLSSLLIQVVVCSIFFSPRINLGLNRGLLPFVQRCGQYSLFSACVSEIDWLQCTTILMGFLLVGNEANLLVRHLFQVLDRAPKKEDTARAVVIVDRREYNAGRVIGILERMLIYLFILTNQFTTIGFILAAKSFARFYELEQREFAEYVLIGTLLSALLAVSVAWMVKLLLA